MALTLRRSSIHGALLALVVAGVAHALPESAPASPEAVAREFYGAFVKGDTATMNRLYAPDVKFQDTIFSFKDRAGTMGMWKILVDPSSGAKFTARVVSVQGEKATCHWAADYKLFGRPIHNEIDSVLTIRDGRIVDHRDAFPWAPWAKQAFPLGRFSDVAPIRWVLKTALRAGMAFQIWQHERAEAKAGRAPNVEAARGAKAPVATPGAAAQETAPRKGMVDRLGR